MAASIGWSLATPLAEQGTGRTRRAVGGAQIRGMVHRGAFQALPNMVEMQEGCARARDAQIFADGGNNVYYAWLRTVSATGVAPLARVNEASKWRSVMFLLRRAMATIAAGCCGKRCRHFG